MINTVISVCERKDQEAWAVASDYVVKNIEAENYLLIVPDSQVEEFQACTNAAYEIVGETNYIGDLATRIAAKLPTSQASRMGWYLQQFVKLSALERASDQELLLIWDADTVPLKKLNFVSPQGQVLHYVSGEYHQPAYDNVTALLSLEKQVSYSFVAQSFAIKGAWVKEFMTHIEELHQRPWQEAILESIDFNESSGFSEYEVLGAYLTAFHNEHICANHTRWQRFGNRMIGEIGNLRRQPFKYMLRRFDFVSFEVWDAPEQNASTLRLVANALWPVVKAKLLKVKALGGMFRGKRA